MIDLTAAYILFMIVVPIDLAMRLWAYNKTHDDRIKHDIFWWRYY